MYQYCDKPPYSHKNIATAIQIKDRLITTNELKEILIDNPNKIQKINEEYTLVSNFLDVINQTVDEVYNKVNELQLSHTALENEVSNLRQEIETLHNQENIEIQTRGINLISDTSNNLSLNSSNNLSPRIKSQINLIKADLDQLKKIIGGEISNKTIQHRIKLAEEWIQNTQEIITDHELRTNKLEVEIKGIDVNNATEEVLKAELKALNTKINKSIDSLHEEISLLHPPRSSSN